MDWPEPAHGPLFSDSTLALQAAAEGHGVALGRRLLVEHLLEQRVLMQLFDVVAPMEEAFFIVYSKESSQRAEVAAFVAWIKSIAQEERNTPRRIP